MMRDFSFAAGICIQVSFLLSVPTMAETLDDAWSIALASSPRLAATEYQNAASVQDLESTRAERLPDASLRSSYTVRDNLPSFRVDNSLFGFDSFPFAQQNSAAAEILTRMPVYTSGRIKNSILRAQAHLSATQHNAAATRSDLFLAIGNAYLSVLRAQQELAVAEQDLTNLSAHEAEVKCLFDLQRVPRNDLLAAQVTTATASQKLLRAKNQLQTVCGAYNRLLGRSLGVQFQLQELRLPWLPHSLDQLEQVAWQQRPELLLLKASADERYFEAQRLLAARRPQVSAVGRYKYQENQFQTPEAIASAALIIDWSLLDGGRKKRAANAELSRAASLERLFADSKSQVSLDVLSAWNDRQESAARLTVAKRTTELADENLRVSRLRYTRGMALQTEVLDAQSRRTQVARDYFSATYDISLAQLQLRHAAGILGTLDPWAANKPLP